MCARAADPARTDPPKRVHSAATRSGVRALTAAPVRRALARTSRTQPVHTVRRGFGIGRLLLAGLGVVALAGYFDYVLGFATFQIYNYFSYFTVQSGMAAIVAFAAAAFVAFRHTTDPPWLNWFRLLVTTYITVSGIVFLTIVIQSSSLDYTIEVPWSSQLLHFWIPTIALLDWLTDAGKARLPWKILVWVLVVPSIWGVHAHPRVDRGVVPVFLPRPGAGARPARDRDLLPGRAAALHRDRRRTHGHVAAAPAGAGARTYSGVKVYSLVRCPPRQAPQWSTPDARIARTRGVHCTTLGPQHGETAR